MAHIHLVSTPFGSLNLPSLGLSLIRDSANNAGHSAVVSYLSFSFANTIGPEFYSLLSLGYPSNTSLAGDYLFSVALNGYSTQDIATFVDQLLKDRANNSSFGLPNDFEQTFVRNYLHAATCVQEWVASAAKTLAESKADCFGFTSMFQQNAASLAIARVLKSLLPDSTIILGGPNCEGTMGTTLLNAYSWIDYVCSGEGEAAIVSFLTFLDNGRHGDLHNNIITRDDFRHPSTEHKAVDISRCGPPTYDEYFEQSAVLIDKAQFRPRVLLETSRGCWWGEKAHCTFCGLNGLSMKFRGKSAEQALRDIRHLATRYPGCPISVVDNIIDYRYFNTLLPSLASENIDVELFYETKANLTREQLQLLAAAGVRRIQPGIESLSSTVLSIMKKGVSAHQNVQLLKQCVEVGVAPEWNMLWGFPGEPKSEYQVMSTLVEALTHLPPPNAAASIRLDRFSPLYELADTSGIRNVRPYPAYFAVYDVAPDLVEGIAYYFTFDYVDERNVREYTQSLASAIDAWKLNGNDSYLFYLCSACATLIFDGRRPRGPRVLRAPAPWGAVLERCEKPIFRSKLEDSVSFDSAENVVDVPAAIDALCHHGVIVEIDNKLYNVANAIAEGVCIEKQSLLYSDLSRMDVGTSDNTYSIPTICLA